MKEITYEKELKDKATERARLFVIDGKEQWLPRSEIVVYPLHNKLQLNDWLYYKALRG